MVNRVRPLVLELVFGLVGLGLALFAGIVGTWTKKRTVKQLSAVSVHKVRAFQVFLFKMETVIFIDHIAEDIIRLVASVCVRVCVSVRLSVGTLLFELFDL